MASIYKRGTKLWARIRDRAGKRAGKPTPYREGDERKAERYAAELQRIEDAARTSAAMPDSAPLTVEAYAPLHPL